MSKLCIQAQRDPGGLVDFVRETGMRFVKLIDPNAQLVKDIAATSPATKIIIRIYEPDQNLNKVQAYADKVTAAIDPYRAFAHAVEFYNEVGCQTPDEAKRQNDAQVAYSNSMRARGIKTIAYSFSTGVPRVTPFDPDNLWVYLWDGCRAADYIGTHAYWATEPYLFNSPYHALRHRAVHAVMPDDLKSKQWILTECGIDFGVLAGRSGGYKANGVSIGDYMQQMKLFAAEIDKDDYVVGATLFGFGMFNDWFSFDLADDRAALAEVIKQGSVITPPQPTKDKMSTPKERVENAWRSVGVVFNPDAAFYKAAQLLNLGRPVGNEYRYVGADGVKYAGQPFERALIECTEGDWTNAKPFDLLTGLPYVPSVTPPVTGGGKRLTALPDFLSAFKFKADFYPQKTGEEFYGLIAVSRPIIDVVPRFAFQVSDMNGGADATAFCYHVFGNTYECFQTGGDGYVEFQLGPGSKYFPERGESPTDKFYVGTEFRDKDLEQPPAPPISDVFFYGLPDQRHIDTTYSVRKMRG